MKRRPSLSLSLVVLALLGASVRGQEVTLPLERYEDLRQRLRPVPTPPASLPADYALEAAQIDVVAARQSARVTQRLTLSLYTSEWLSIPLPTVGNLTSSQLGTLEGRVAGDQDLALIVRGRGRHVVRLDSVVPLGEDKSAARLTRTLTVSLPSAAVVAGSLAVSDDEIQEIVVATGGLARGGAAAGRTEFVGQPEATLVVRLLGPGRVVDKARLPLKLRALSSAVTEVSRTRLKVSARLVLDVQRGQLERLAVTLPQGFDVATVTPADLGWEVADGILLLTPASPIEKTLDVGVELTGEAREGFSAPLLVPRDVAQVTLLAAVQVAADGLPEIVDIGASRKAVAADLAALPQAHRAAKGPFFLVRDAQRAPRWSISWSEGAKVLAAQVDRLVVSVVCGLAERASYEVWAVVRSSGSTEVALKPPEGLELLAVERNGTEVQPGVAERGLVIPLAAGAGAQVIHLSGLLRVGRVPLEGDLSIPIPSFSAPVARVEVHASLPGGRTYALAQEDRASPRSTIPTATTKVDPGPAGALSALATRASASAPAARAPFEDGAGAIGIDAAWSALSESPGPLVIRVKPQGQKEEWF